MPRRIALAAVLLLGTAAAVAPVGCGGDKPRGKVHGTLTYHDKPLAGSTVILMASDNQVHRAEIGKDGRYEFPAVAYGEVKVSIQQEVARVPVRPEPRGSTKGGIGESKDSQLTVAPPSVPLAQAYALPPRYADAAQSGLTFEVKSPDQEWSSDLK